MATPTTPVRQPGDPIPPPPEPRYPWRVGITMFGLVALVLLVVWLGFQAVRGPQTSGQFPTAPTATAYALVFRATVSAADTAEPRPTRAPTAQPTVAPTAASALTVAPAATASIATTVAAPALVKPTTTTPDIGAMTSTPATSVTQVAAQSATASPVPALDPELASEVSAAYARYWQVLADADWSNDSSTLDQVAAGGQLDTLRNNILEDQSLNRATRVRVQHSYSVVSAQDDQAQVQDHIQDLSVYVDPSTHEPLPGEVEPSTAEAAPTTDATFQLQLLDGTWKVVSATRIGGDS